MGVIAALAGLYHTRILVLLAHGHTAAAQDTLAVIPYQVGHGGVGVVALVGEGLGVDGVEPVARGAHLGALLA